MMVSICPTSKQNTIEAHDIRMRENCHSTPPRRLGDLCSVYVDDWTANDRGLLWSKMLVQVLRKTATALSSEAFDFCSTTLTSLCSSTVLGLGGDWSTSLANHDCIHCHYVYDLWLNRSMSRTFTSNSMSPAMYYAVVEGSRALLGFRQEAATMLCSCQADLVLRRSSHSLMQVAVYSKECAT